MLVTRRNQDFMPTLFNELMNWNDTTYSTPRMNIMETKDNYKLELCIPGLTKEDVKLSIDAEGNLVVEMVKENKSEKKENKEEMRYLRHEFSVEHFRQTVMLPEDIHKEQISAKVENGILDIIIPKVTVDEKKQAVQTIEVCQDTEGLDTLG